MHYTIRVTTSISNASLYAGMQALADLGIDPNQSEMIARAVLTAALPHIIPPKKKHLPQDKVREIVGLYLSGKTSVEIGRKFAINPHTVMYHVKACARRSLLRMNAAKDSGFKVAQHIAREYNVSTHVVLDIVNRYGNSARNGRNDGGHHG
jgi:DNA-binding CsgD family transcriptional regulator